MKRVLALTIAVILVLLCCACGDEDETATAAKKTTKKSGNNTSSQTSTDDSDDTDSKPTPTVSVEGSGFQGQIEVEAYSYPQVKPEYGTLPETLDTAWDATVLKKGGGAENKAIEMRKSITNTANTLDIYKSKVTGKVYYVSPNGNDSNDGLSPAKAVQTLNAELFTLHKAKPGDAVLFERNGVWRVTNAFKCDSGIVYGSYGTGSKPAILGSPRNYANPEFWLPSNRENIWKISVVDDDVGMVVCNHGELVGTKRMNGVITLEKNGDFYFNNKQDTLYYYCDKGNPGKAYKDIELCVHKSIIGISQVNNVIFDNFRLKYAGHMGINMRDADNCTISNCEVGFIGGCIQSGTLRYGNGIQIWDEVDGHRVENCWIYQVYDAGVSWQGDNTYAQGFTTTKHSMKWWRENGRNSNVEYKNIYYVNNLIEYCTYSIEFWHGADTKYNSSNLKWEEITPNKWSVRIENFIVQNNLLRMAGYGFGSQRPDFMANHICVWRRPLTNVSNCKITNNIMDMCDSYIVYWQFNGTDENKAKGPDKWDIRDNIYYQGKNKFNDGVNYPSMSRASNKDELQALLKVFDDNPTLYWIS